VGAGNPPTHVNLPPPIATSIPAPPYFIIVFNITFIQLDHIVYNKTMFIHALPGIGSSLPVGRSRLQRLYGSDDPPPGLLVAISTGGTATFLGRPRFRESPPGSGSGISRTEASTKSPPSSFISGSSRGAGLGSLSGPAAVMSWDGWAAFGVEPVSAAAVAASSRRVGGARLRTLTYRRISSAPGRWRE
jgi:hypothetical protein